jgi:TRAP-type C4-dicarboxylate transport system substrate-binding protein
MNMFKNLASAALTAAALAVPLAATAEEWRGYSYTAAGQPAFQGLERISKAVTEATAGRVNFRFNPGGSMPIQVAAITQAVGDGMIAAAGDGFYTSSVPVGGIAFLPMLFSSRQEFDAGLKVLEPYLDSALEKLGVKLIGYYYYPLQTAFARVKVTSLDDFKGRRVRTTSAEQSEFVKRLGGTPVTIGTPEVPTSLQRGVIDVIFTASSGGARSYHEMLTHNLRIGPNFHLSLITVNLNRFKKLSPADQKAMLSAGRENGAWITGQYTELEDKFKGDYAKAGMVVTEPDAASVKRARDMVSSYWGQWAAQKGPVATEALNKVLAGIAK